MSWVTCQLVNGRTRAINTDQVSSAEDKTTSTVLFMACEDPIIVLGGLKDWLGKVDQATLRWT
jgi:hypothetical protein